MRIAVVGSGVSGLVSAWLLSRMHDVVLFEANDYLGGHTHTHDVLMRGRCYRVDTGFIVFNPAHYPLLTLLFRELGVASQPTTMSFSVRNEATGLEYNATSLGGLFCQRRNLVSPRFLGMLRDLLRFYREATTISQEQYALACERVQRAGLGDRVSVLRQDYRDLSGQYDKLVSIEMIEAIGAEYLDTYFGKLGSLLRPGGRGLLQAITIEDHRYAQALRSVDYIKRHVFPGSFIPSIQAMLMAKTRATDLALIDLEDFGQSYARTLQAWRERFLTALPQVRQLGFDVQFIRLWEFYLAYCEGGFREKSIGVSHLLFAKP